MEAAKGEGWEGGRGTVRPWTRRLDAGFFQQGHGRMDVGIMEASTVPSLPDKNCRWKEDDGEGDEGRISRREEGERRAEARVGKGRRSGGR